MPSFLDMFRRFVPTWSEIIGKPVTFDPGAHKTSHQSGGSDQVSVAGLSGVLASAQDAGAIKGVTINDAAKADQFCLVYDSGTNRVIYVELPGA